MPQLESQKKLIHETDWDALIILDACRYDYFEQVYENYLDGELKEVYSEGSNTKEWLPKTFRKKNHKYNDIVYVSANPHINSKGVELVDGFNGSDYFHKIIDVWDYGWNEELNTVPPDRMSKATIMAKTKYPDKRLISHFTQPHWPYLSLGPIVEDSSEEVAMARGEMEKTGNKSKSLISKLRGFLFWHVLVEFFPPPEVCKFREVLYPKREKESKAVATKLGHKGLAEAYEDNLRSALGEVEQITNRLPGKICVTSDHGELLGEYGFYQHPGWFRGPTLRKVPWLIIK